MRLIFLLLIFVLPFSLFALVGGKEIYDRPSVVALHDFEGGVYCTGVVVGLHPLTVLTAAHCVKDREKEEIVIEENQPLKVIIGNKGILGLDLAVLIFKSNIKIAGVLDKNIFKIDKQQSLGLVNYRGKIEMCGFGGELNSVLVSQKTGNLKCGSGLYLAQKSYTPLLHSLYSKKLMSCLGWAQKEEYRGLKLAHIFPGDSGGPLFIENNEELLLVGITKDFTGREVDEANQGPLSDCDIDQGSGYKFNWTSVLPSNEIGTLFLKQAKERFGADIQGL